MRGGAQLANLSLQLRNLLPLLFELLLLFFDGVDEE